MDNQLGIGAFKFQSVISKEIRTSKEANNMRSQLKMDHRLSLIEKSKLQIKHSRKPLNQQSTSPKQPLLILTDKIQHQFILNVSSSSSSSESITISESSDNKNAYKQLKKLGMTLLTPQPSPKKNLQSYNNNQYKIKQQQKRDIQFLRSLNQNSELINNNLLKLDEYKIDKDIYVDIDCKEISAFLRLQHEVEEMRRKSGDFQFQKQRHFNVFKNKKETKQTDDFWTVMMAKRTAKKLIKNMNLKRKKSNEMKKAQSIHVQ